MSRLIHRPFFAVQKILFGPRFLVAELLVHFLVALFDSSVYVLHRMQNSALKNFVGVVICALASPWCHSRSA